MYQMKQFIWYTEDIKHPTRTTLIFLTSWFLDIKCGFKDSTIQQKTGYVVLVVVVVTVVVGLFVFIFCFVLFCFLFCFVLFCFVLFFVLFFCFVLFCFVLFCFCFCFVFFDWTILLFLFRGKIENYIGIIIYHLVYMNSVFSLVKHVLNKPRIHDFQR